VGGMGSLGWEGFEGGKDGRDHLWEGGGILWGGRILEGGLARGRKKSFSERDGSCCYSIMTFDLRPRKAESREL